MVENLRELKDLDLETVASGKSAVGAYAGSMLTDGSPVGAAVGAVGGKVGGKLLGF